MAVLVSREVVVGAPGVVSGGVDTLTEINQYRCQDSHDTYSHMIEILLDFIQHDSWT